MWHGHLGGLSARGWLRAAAQDRPLQLSRCLTARSGLCYYRTSLRAGDVTEPTGVGMGRSPEVRGCCFAGLGCAWLPVTSVRGGHGGRTPGGQPEQTAEGPGQPLFRCLSSLKAQLSPCNVPVLVKRKQISASSSFSARFPRSVSGPAGRSEGPPEEEVAAREKRSSQHAHSVQTVSGCAQPRALRAAGEEHFREKKEQIPNHKNFTAAKSSSDRVAAKLQIWAR